MKKTHLRTEKRQTLITAIMLACLLFLIYLATYSGTPLTDDERRIIDTTDSLAIRGTLLLNETTYIDGLLRTSVEPAQPLLSIPLYWIAYHLPWVGNVQALYLFAPFVTALTAAILYVFARHLGYKHRLALIATLLFGLGTVVWPYTKTYFREPLSMLLIFAAAFAADNWRIAFTRGRSDHWKTLVILVTLIILSVLVKEAAIIALPALALYAMPSLDLLWLRRKQIAVIGIILLSIAISFGLLITILPDLTYSLATRYEFGTRLVRLQEGIANAGRGIAGYLFSPGKGIWWFSPILLLVLPAPWLRSRERWRETWLPLGLTLWFAVVYAIIRGVQWQGGTGWGARYMVPLTPFLMVAALPALERLLKGGWKSRVSLAVLTLVSVMVQIGGVYVYLFDYEHHLVESTGLPPFDTSLIWRPRWSQAVGTLLYLGQGQSDIRWLIDGTDWLMLIVLLIMILAISSVLMQRIRARISLPDWAIIAGVCAVTIGTSAFALYRAYNDPRYLADRTDLKELRQYLAEHVDHQDIIFLSSPSYSAYFMNYYKGKADWYSLPLAPGERYSLEQDPSVVSEDLRQQVGPVIRRTLGDFPYGRVFYPGDQRFWLVGDLTPWAHPWSTRPTEHLMTHQLFQVDAVDFSETVRLTSYLPYLAPDEDSSVENPLDLSFGNNIGLVGADFFTHGQRRLAEESTPGDPIGISLMWEARAPVDLDYTVAVFIIGPDGLPILQQDRMPVGGFRPTNTWESDEMIRDNYGFILPQDLPPGAYEIWVVIYDWRTGNRLQVTGPDGGALGDYAMLKRFVVKP